MAQAPYPFSRDWHPISFGRRSTPGSPIRAATSSSWSTSLGHHDETLEREILAQVGSYGRQIGHLAEAQEVVIALQPKISKPAMVTGRPGHR